MLFRYSANFGDVLHSRDTENMFAIKNDRGIFDLLILFLFLIISKLKKN